jgi:H+/Na+-translocating ferredoxin:NAD+ oxidoreductase subunit C
MLEYTPERRFSRGIRIAAHKEASTDKPIRRGLIPRQLILGLKQHQGSPATPVVEPGQRVLKHQLLARAGAHRSAGVHAPTSGRVTAIEERLTPAVNEVHRSRCIVIETDGADEAVDAEPAPWPADRNARIERIRDGGIVGLGGAVFPTAEKLGTETACRLLIVNGAECEPYISCDDMLMRDAPESIVSGALLMQELLDAPECVIAIERDKPQAIESISRAAYEAGAPNLRIAEIPTVYPAGGERQLIELLTGREVPSAEFPSRMGYVCQNVGTAHALERLATAGRPLISRIVTVTGAGVETPQNVEALIGTPISELIAFCGGYTESADRLIVGGSMMGYTLPGDGLPITKASNCILVAGADEIRVDYSEWQCIRCGDCGTICPVRLLPQELSKAARASDYELLRDLGLEDCIECGCCDVICPSHIPLTEEFRRAKFALIRHDRQLTFSASSDERYRRREERREAERRSTRDEQDTLIDRLRGETKPSDAIRAAVARARRRKEQQDDD